MPVSAEYLRNNVYFRCGHAVSRLCEAGLTSRPQLASSEQEINEWWLVSEDLAKRLAVSGQPVLQFHELNMWGRQAAGMPLEDDLDLRSALWD